MKKALALMFAVCVMLTGCGNKEESKETTTKAVTTTTKVIEENSVNSTTTTTKKVEGAIILGDSTDADDTTTTTVIVTDAPSTTEVTDNKTTTTTTKKTETVIKEGSFSKDDAVIQTGSVKIKVNDDFKNIKASLGEPEEEYSSPSCLYEGDDKTFIYSDMTIYTYPSGDKDKVLEVEVTGGNATTPDGLKIGLSYDEVKSIYGSCDYDGYSCEYSDGSVYLYIDFENDKVTGFGIFTN